MRVQGCTLNPKVRSWFHEFLGSICCKIEAAPKKRGGSLSPAPLIFLCSAYSPHPRVITAPQALHIVVEGPLPGVPELYPYHRDPAGDGRVHLLDHPSLPPFTVPQVAYHFPHGEI